jgi:hypothetical protein
MLTSGALPVGATMSPALPLTAVNAMSTFNWTSPVIGNYVMNFAALDGSGRQATQSVTLTVTNTPPTISCVASGGAIEATGPGGAVFSIDATVNDANDDDLVVRVFTDGVLRQTSP